MNSSAKFFSEHSEDEFVNSSYSLSIGNDVSLTSNLFKLAVNDLPLQNLRKYSVSFTPEVREEQLAEDIIYKYGENKDPERWMTKGKVTKKFIFEYPCTILSTEEMQSFDVQFNDITYHIDLSEGESVNEQETVDFVTEIIRRAAESVEFECLDDGFISRNPEVTIQNTQIMHQYHINACKSGVNEFSLLTNMEVRIFKGQTLKQLIYPTQGEYEIPNKEKGNLEVIAKQNMYATNFGHKRTVKIEGISWEQPRIIEVNGEQTTVPKYMHERYAIPISEREPCARVKREENGKIIIEFIPVSCLEVVGLTKSDMLDAQFIHKIKRYSELSPTDIANKIVGFVEKIKKASILSELGISINEQVALEGSIIQPPLIRFRSTQKEKKTVEFTDIPMSSSCSLIKEISKYQVALSPVLKASPLIICHKNAIQYANDMKANLIKISSSMGIPLLPPDIEYSNVKSKDQFINAISHGLQIFGVPSFVVVILPTDNEDFYNGVKEFLTSKLGLHSQFILESTFSVPSSEFRIINQKMMLDIIAKVGGVPFYIPPASLPLRSTVFVGIEKEGSICSVVKSTDVTYARYDSVVKKVDNPMDFFLSVLEKVNASRIVIFTSMPAEEAKEIADYLEGKVPSFVMISCEREKLLLITTSTRQQQAASPGTVFVYNNAIILSSASSGQDIARPSSYIVVHRPKGLWTDNQLVTIIHYLCVGLPISFESSPLPTPLVYAQEALKFKLNTLKDSEPNKLLTNFPYYL